MRRYIEHIRNTRTPHERRQHALQVAGVLTAVLFVSWLATLSLRIGTGGEVVNNNGSNNTAATLQAVQGENSSTLLGY